jgi:guanylate kinase
VMPPSVEALEKRLRYRQTESEEKIQMRLAKANEELSMGSEFDVELINADLDVAITEAKKLVTRFLE